jgi:hypothetical protein
MTSQKPKQKYLAGCIDRAGLDLKGKRFYDAGIHKTAFGFSELRESYRASRKFKCLQSTFKKTIFATFGNSYWKAEVNVI